MTNATLTVALSQMAPAWINRALTTEKVLDQIHEAAKKNAQLIVFGECLLPGYPFWVELTNGARFNTPDQQELYAHYLDQAVSIESGHLDPICQAAKKYKIAIYLGILERPADRSGHSVYCSLVYIDQKGVIGSVHRKLMPTYEERLVWATGDGHGLRAHDLEEFRVGGLSCWENWMPLSRAALYGQGVNVHIAVWPGNERNTIDITRFIAMESRSYVLSVCGLMRHSDIPDDIPYVEKIRAAAPEYLANGGTCIAAPDGTWLVEPTVGTETLVIADLELQQIHRQRHNFDPAGHYSRPDVTRLTVDRTRQQIINLKD